MDKGQKPEQGMPFNQDANPPGKNNTEIPKKSEAKKSNLRTPFIIILLAAIFALSAAVAFFVNGENEKNKRLEAEGILQRLTQAKADVEARLEETEKIMIQYQNDLMKSRQQMKSVEAKADELREQNMSMGQMIDEKIQQIVSLRDALTKEKGNSASLTGKISELEQGHDELRAQLSQIRMAKDALENRIIELNRKRAKGVELGTIVVSDEAAKTAAAQPSGGVRIMSFPPAGTLEGQILVVNKEFSFVVINLGLKNGLKESAVLDVYRGPQLLGKVQVERIYDTMSSAVILPEHTKEELKEGDMVRFI